MFPLHPETPEQGLKLEELFNVSSEQIRSMIIGLQEKAQQLGLEFGPRSATYNSRRAQELGLWAAEQGYGDIYDMAVFRAYFVDGINIAKVDELLKIADAVGLDIVEAERILINKTYSEALDKEWAIARGEGVTAIPTFCVEGDTVVGAQSSIVLQSLLEKHGAKRRHGVPPLPLF